MVVLKNYCKKEKRIETQNKLNFKFLFMKKPQILGLFYFYYPGKSPPSSCSDFLGINNQVISMWTAPC